MGERIGVEQAIVFRGKTIEEIIEKYNKFNKDNDNVEFVSFTVTSDIIEERKHKEGGSNPATVTKFEYAQPYGIYNYVEYVKDKILSGGFG